MTKRVLVASSSPADRGSGIRAYVNELTESLISTGVQVHYYAPPARDTSWLDERGIASVSAGQDDDPIEATAALVRYVRDRSIEGVINNDNPFVASAGPFLECPVLSVGHMDRRSVGALACFQEEWIDHVVSISSDMQRTFVRRYGVPIAKTPIVYNGVRDPGPRERSSHHGPLYVVYAGGYSYNKGSKLVLDAVLADSNDWNGVVLDWFGGVPERVRRRTSNREFVRIHDRVPRDEFHRTLRNADVFLLPSRKEGCPMALLEAMSFGAVPIVSDGIGAMRWIVTNGRDGFVCPIDRYANQLTECLTYLRDDRSALEKLRAAGRERFLSSFQSHHTSNRLLELLERPTVDRSRAPARVPVLRWHRPLRPDGLKAPLVDRFCIRFGILRRAGTLEHSAIRS